jgi:hypothetical protein
MELEPSGINFKPVDDRRPLIPEPLPVRLVAIDDLKLPAQAGIERQLDAFYVGLLGFVRDDAEPQNLIYRADNVRLRFDVLEPPVDRDEYRPTVIEVPSLLDFEHKLMDAEHDYERQRGLTSGTDMLVLRDPAGNWLEVMSFARVR